MGTEINLTRSLPKPDRPIADRLASKTPEVIKVAKQFGRNYFDGDRAYGYGGYKDDGRWAAVAIDIANHFKLYRQHRMLDVGCAKGFLVKEIKSRCNAYGIDVSRHAVMNCSPYVVGRVHLGNAISLPFPDHSIEAIVSINTIHNLKREECIQALREIERVTRDSRAYVQVDSYRNEEEKRRFLDWNLTAETHGTPDDWMAIFEEANYKGDFSWTIT